MKKNKSTTRSGVRKCEDNNKRKFQKDTQGKKQQEGEITQQSQIKEMTIERKKLPKSLKKKNLSLTPPPPSRPQHAMISDIL